MRSRSNGGVIGAYALPSQNYANGVFFIHDAAIYNTGPNPIWPLASGTLIYNATGGTISTAADNTNFKTHTFTSNGTFTVVNGSAYLEILLVGGGGPGGFVATTSTNQYGASGGGGGGQVVLVSTWVNPNTTFTVTVGGGGTVNNGQVITNGYNTVVTSNGGHSYGAYGGGAGASVAPGSSYVYSVNTNGGVYVGPSGGGGAYWRNSTTYYYGPSVNSFSIYSNTPGTISIQQNAGALANASATVSDTAGGGGGGAGTSGIDGNKLLTNYSYGGNGWQWNRTGYYYGAGGAGGTSSGSAQSGLYSNAVRYPEKSSYIETATNGYGLGGSGEYLGPNTTIYPGMNGGSGTVIFCYRYQ